MARAWADKGVGAFGWRKTQICYGGADVGACHCVDKAASSKAVCLELLALPREIGKVGIGTENTGKVGEIMLRRRWV